MDRTEQIKTYIESHKEEMREKALNFYMDNIDKYFNDEFKEGDFYYMVFNIDKMQFEILKEIGAKTLILFILGYANIKSYNDKDNYKNEEEWINETKKRVIDYEIPFCEMEFKTNFEKLGTNIEIGKFINYK